MFVYTAHKNYKRDNKIRKNYLTWVGRALRLLITNFLWKSARQFSSFILFESQNAVSDIFSKPEAGKKQNILAAYLDLHESENPFNFQLSSAQLP